MTTANTNELAVANAEQELKMPEKVKDLTGKQKGWLSLENTKSITTQKLTTYELEIQKELDKIEEIKDLPLLQERLAKAKSIAAEAKDCRLYFTNIIEDGVKKPLMAFEKRNDELIQKAENAEFALRKIESGKEEAARKHTAEKARFEAHVRNEYFRIANEYKDHLLRRINFYYTDSLFRKLSKSEVEDLIKDVSTELGNIAIPPTIKFETTILSDDNKRAVIASIPKFDSMQVLVSARISLREEFAMYEEDLQNQEAAIANANKKLEEDTAARDEKLEQEQAVNTLVAAAESIEIQSTAKIIVNMVVEIENTEKWAMAVIANSIKNWSSIRSFFRNKTWDKLSLGQMANALGKLATNDPEMKFEGLTIKEEEK